MLMLLAKPPAKPGCGVSVEESVSRCNRAKIEVISPPAQFLIQTFHQFSGIHPFHVSVCLDTYRFGHTLDTLPRGTTGYIRPPGLGRIAPTKGVSQEIEFIIRQAAGPRLFFVHRQLQPAHYLSHRMERLLSAVTLATNNQIVSVVDDPCTKPLSKHIFFHPKINRRMYRLDSRGEIGEPCGMPCLVSRLNVVRLFRSRSSLSSTGALSHILIRCSIRRSTTRRATDFMSSTCGIVSKETTTHYPPSGLPRTGDHHPSASPFSRAVSGSSPTCPHAWRFAVRAHSARRK